MAFEGFEDISGKMVRYLSAAGWEQTTQSRESEVPEFVCHGKEINTTVFQHLDGKSVRLTLQADGAYRRVEVAYGDSLDLLLPLLASWGPHLCTDFLLTFLKEIAKSVPEVLLQPLEGNEDTPWERILP
ncbi:hypothetical protein ACFXI8_26805 [Streptomyces niveus]|uniref:hypothetical protein n=1 Tax=Streptomyces niveus TaxID=193462 RepID=UPI0036BC077B